MAWGVEGRVPFLDKDFIDVAMRINPVDKMSIVMQPDGKQRMEKWILRKAFEDCLPADIVWRQKEQFSDGVGYNWIDTLKKVTEEKISDAQFATRDKRFPVNTPATKEEYYYREIFSKFFPSETAAKTVPHEASIACSTAKALEWDAAWKNMDEPSGRAMKGVHVAAYKE
jgi:asparagine synthase (glutamine-hydrolysing)